jgi:hypothetical protein
VDTWRPFGIFEINFIIYIIIYIVYYNLSFCIVLNTKIMSEVSNSSRSKRIKLVQIAFFFL